MTRRWGYLVLDGPLAGKWVADYGLDCRLIHPWSPASALAPEVYHYMLQTFFFRTPDGYAYIVRGYVRRYRTIPGDIPRVALVALLAQALLSS